ncbi:hypothetical protein D3C85_944050 [compost metagenome]
MAYVAVEFGQNAPQTDREGCAEDRVMGHPGDQLGDTSGHRLHKHPVDTGLRVVTPCRVHDFPESRADLDLIRQVQAHTACLGLVRDIRTEHLEYHRVTDSLCRQRRRVRVASRRLGHSRNTELAQQTLGFELIEAGQGTLLPAPLHLTTQARPAPDRFAPRQPVAERRQRLNGTADIGEHRHAARAQLLTALGLAGVDGDEQARMLRADFQKRLGHAVEQRARCIDDHRVDRIGACQCAEHRTDEVGVVDDVPGHVDRVGNHPVVGDAIAQGLLDVHRQGGDIQARPDELVRQDRAQRAG